MFTTIQQSVAENLVPSAGFTELSSLGPVDNQYSFVQFILSGSTQGIDHRVDGSAGLMGGIQVEQAVGGAVTNMNVWDGAAWVLAVPSVWDGSVWVPVVGKVWDGSQWT